MGGGRLEGWVPSGWCRGGVGNVGGRERNVDR